MAAEPASLAEAAADAAQVTLTEKDGAVRFEVHAKPKAHATAVRGVRDGAFVVALAAPPVDGAANEELVRFIAERLGIARRDVRLLRGEGSRTKLLEVRGLAAREVRRRLAP